MQDRDGCYAAIDLGSNACRLLIAQRKDGVTQSLETFSRTVRLAEGLTKTNRLSDVAIKRAIAAIELCGRKVRHFGAQHIRAVATAACRRATNGDWFLNHLGQVTGIPFDLISHEEEARLALIGCSNLLTAHQPRALIFDIGGGSTEVMWVEVEAGKPLKTISYISLPFGVVTIAEEFPEQNLQMYRAIYQRTLEALRAFDAAHSITEALQAGQVQMIGTSGTATTTAALDLGLRRYTRDKIDGHELTQEQVAQIIKLVQMMPPDERAFNPCIGQERSDLVLGGMAILEAICSLWPTHTLRVADRGVREGLVDQLIFGPDYMPIPRARAIEAA